MAVSNSSPLIHLSRLSKLNYVKEVFPSLTIPASVRTETIEKGKSKGYSDALTLEVLEKSGWLKTADLSEKSLALAEQLTPLLERGEAEAI
jgi:predicted nucleic acid-binding protein